MKVEIKESIDRYVTYGVQLGDFLTAVMENNLMEAVGRADEDNQAHLAEICAYVYNEIPTQCHGSSEKVRVWINHHGTKGA